MGRHRTDEKKAAFKVQATEMRLAGIGVKRIAGTLGISQELVHALLVGVAPPRGGLRAQAKDEHREAAIALREEGRSYAEIEKELGVSKGSLSLWLRELPPPSEEQRAQLRGRQVPPAGNDPHDDRGLARALRADGWLLREIADALMVSVTTASSWCEGLPVPPRALHRVGRAEVAEAGKAYWDARRPVIEAERLAAIAAAEAQVPPISSEMLQLLAAVAYWCEGSKSKPWRRSEMLILINSDPDVIRLWCAWLGRRGVGMKRLGFRLSIHVSGDVEGSTRYWADVVGCDVADFSRPSLKRHNPRTVRKNVGSDYHGCLVITVRQSRDLYREIEGTWRGLVERALDQPGVRQTDGEASTM